MNNRLLVAAIANHSHNNWAAAKNIFKMDFEIRFLDALASLESMMSVIVSLTENNWVTDRKFSILQDVM